MRSFVILLSSLLLLSLSSLALKQSRVRGVNPARRIGRRAQDDGEEKSNVFKGEDEKVDKADKDENDKGKDEKDKDKELKEDKAAKEEKEPKEEKGPKEPKEDKASKEDKTDKKKKKCKKAKRTESRRFLQGTEPVSSPVQEPSIAVNAEGEEDVRFCLHGELTPSECDAAKRGMVPRNDKRVNGDLKLNIIHDDDTSSSAVLEKVTSILSTETSPDFLGCNDEAERRRMEEASGSPGIEYTIVDATNQTLVVTGVTFANLTVSTPDDCEKSPGLSCSSIETDFDIFYDGKDEVTNEDHQEMFDLLVATILEQAAAGSFEEVGTLESVSAGASDDDDKGIPIPIFAGVVAAVILGAGFIIYKQQNKQSSTQNSTDKVHDTSDSSDDEGEQHDPVARIVEDNEAAVEVQAEAIVVEEYMDEEEKAKKKKKSSS